MSDVPMSIVLPPPPPLVPTSHPTPTNTYALLLPHPALFHSPTLSLLRTFYSSFGPLRAWAPVKGLGRVIIVWGNEKDGSMAKRDGDRVEVEVDKEHVAGDKEYFVNGEGKKKITLRLLALPPTPSNPDPATNHLSAPSLEKNYLISPPGSPPEGWEPIVEDPPNSVSLAEDLRRALEELVLQRGGKKDEADGPEVILETDNGFIVQVEDTGGNDEEAKAGIHLVKATVESMAEWDGSHDEHMEGGSTGWRTPGLGEETFRIMPTARPPM